MKHKGWDEPVKSMLGVDDINLTSPRNTMDFQQPETDHWTGDTRENEPNGTIATSLLKSNNYTELSTVNKTIIGGMNGLQTNVNTNNTAISGIETQIQGLTDNKENLLNGSTFIELQGSTTAPRTVFFKSDVFRITQNFSTQTSNITVGVLGGQGTYLIKGNLQFKKGNNVYSIGSTNTSVVNSFTAQIQSTLGVTWRAYLDTASGSTLGTNITATYTNGTKLINSIDCFTVTFPNTNTVVITCRDNSTTPCTISLDISSLA